MNGFEEKIENMGDIAKKVCDRHFGIGADGMMCCESSKIADVKMNYYNSDGSRAEMCGNGIRCFSRFVYDNNIVNKTSFTVETDAGVKLIDLTIENDNIKYISVGMGKASFESEIIPCSIDKKEILEEKIQVDGKEFEISSLLVGVPHTVVFVEDIENFDVDRIGEKIEVLSIFPKRTNVNFVKILDEQTILIKTWERGAGRTLACGTGSCSAMAVAYKLGKIKSNRAKIITEGGNIFVEINDEYRITMIGEAELICTGEIY